MCIVEQARIPAEKISTKANVPYVTRMHQEVRKKKYVWIAHPTCPQKF